MPPSDNSGGRFVASHVLTCLSEIGCWHRVREEKDDDRAHTHTPNDKKRLLMTMMVMMVLMMIMIMNFRVMA